MGILIFEGLAARRLCKSSGVKGLTIEQSMGSNIPRDVNCHDDTNCSHIRTVSGTNVYIGDLQTVAKQDSRLVITK
jgi:hypothetical protein